VVAVVPLSVIETFGKELDTALVVVGMAIVVIVGFALVSLAIAAPGPFSRLDRRIQVWRARPHDNARPLDVERTDLPRGA
jgi:hypothetical protein